MLANSCWDGGLYGLAKSGGPASWGLNSGMAGGLKLANSAWAGSCGLAKLLRVKFTIGGQFPKWL